MSRIEGTGTLTPTYYSPSEEESSCTVEHGNTLGGITEKSALSIGVINSASKDVMETPRSSNQLDLMTRSITSTGTPKSDVSAAGVPAGMLQLTASAGMIHKPTKNEEQTAARSLVEQHEAWKLLTPAQQQKLTGPLAKLTGDKLKQETGIVQNKLNSMLKLSNHTAWKELSPAQKEQIAHQTVELNGKALGNQLDLTGKRMESVASLSSNDGWQALSSDQRQTITADIMKRSADSSKTTAEEIRSSLDFIGELKNNKVEDKESQETFERLMNLRTDKADAYAALKPQLTEAKKQIGLSKDKEAGARDIKDMLDISIDHGGKTQKPEVFKRLLGQYQQDPADFAKTRDALKDFQDFILVPHMGKKEKVGIEIRSKEIVSDEIMNTVFSEKELSTEDQEKYRNAIRVLEKNEGKAASVNAYDTGVVSLGIKQWTSHEAALAKPLKSFEKNYPEKFQEILPDIKINKEKGEDVITYNGKRLTLLGKEKPWDVIGNLKQSEIFKLAGTFHALGQDADFQKVQVQEITSEIESIRNEKMKKIENLPTIDDYIKSSRGIGHIADFQTNRPGYVHSAFEASVEGFATEVGVDTKNATRQKLLDGLKNKIEADEEFRAAREEEGILEKLEEDTGREEYLEKELIERFKDSFLNKYIQKEKDEVQKNRMEKRFNATTDYYDSLEATSSVQ